MVVASGNNIFDAAQLILAGQVEVRAEESVAAMVAVAGFIHTTFLNQTLHDFDGTVVGIDPLQAPFVHPPDVSVQATDEAAAQGGLKPLPPRCSAAVVAALGNTMLCNERASSR